MINNGWIYFKIVKGCYGLPQSGILANNLLHTRLNKKLYFEATTTPGLWKHQWRPIQFCLIVDNFVIEYVIRHLGDVLKQHYDITEYWTGTKFGGIDINWNYAPKHVEKTCRLCIKDYIKDLPLRFGHEPPSKPQLSLHKHREIMYGANPQMTYIEDTSPLLDESGVKRIMSIAGAVLFYGRAIDNTLLVTLNSIGTQQTAAIEVTNEAVNQMLDYLATYPNDGIVYRSSDIILAAYSDAGFHNEIKGRSRAGAHIFISEDDPIPHCNGPIMSISQVIKFVMTFTAEAKLAALYITAHKIVPMRQTLIEMGWLQPPTPIQKDNTTD